VRSQGWSPLGHWCDVPRENSVRAKMVKRFLGWYFGVLEPNWPVQTRALKPCWPMHGDVVSDLLSLHAGHQAAAVPQVKHGVDGPAKVEGLVVWRELLDKASASWKLSLVDCTPGSCCREFPDNGEPGHDGAVERTEKTMDAARLAWAQELGEAGSRSALTHTPPPPKAAWKIALDLLGPQQATPGEAVPIDAPQGVGEDGEVVADQVPPPDECYAPEDE